MPEKNNITPHIISLASKIELLILDVDGVLTDGKIYCSASSEDTSGELFKSFNIQDGLGLAIWSKKLNKKVAVITGRSKAIISHRLKELGIEHVYDNRLYKIEPYELIKKHFNLQDEQIAYVGDDIIDLGPIQRAGLGCAVANAQQPVKDMANYITTQKGGDGAVREVLNLLFKAQGLEQKILDFYLKP